METDFSKIKKKIGLKGVASSCKKIYTYFYLILILYPILTISLLVYFKPDIICEKKVFDDIDLNIDINTDTEYLPFRIKKSKKVSFSKLIAVFVVLQFPLLIYLIFLK